MSIVISKGNSKLGNKIPNISLRPILDCKNCKFCSKKCYAIQAYKQYPNVRKAWDKNSTLAHANMPEYFEQIREYIEEKFPDYFRFHVAGDILSQKYLDSIILLAMLYPSVKFLCFTKRFDLDYKTRSAKNLTILFSIFPGMPLPKRIKGINFAWCQDGTEKRIPKTSFMCQGSCNDCKSCWHLRDAEVDVVFPMH